MIGRFGGIFLLLTPLIAPPAAAQVVEVQVREETSRAAVSGAIVRLLAEGGPVAQGLTNEGGRVALRPPGPGSFRIKVDRIGWTGILSSPIAVGPGEVDRVLVRNVDAGDGDRAVLVHLLRELPRQLNRLDVRPEGTAEHPLEEAFDLLLDAAENAHSVEGTRSPDRRV